MKPVELRTLRLRLDQPSKADVDWVTDACQDPLFEQVMVTPWPYERHHAESFLLEYVPAAWRDGSELTWVIRDLDGTGLGIIGMRKADNDIGYWLRSSARGRGIATEAVGAVLQWNHRVGAFPEPIQWWTVKSNFASARVAEKLGFRFLGEAPRPARYGLEPCWVAEFRTGDTVDAWPPLDTKSERSER